MIIKIINGTYGLRTGGFVELKTVDDKPFEVSDEEASKLVDLHVAEIVSSTSDLDPKPIPEPEQSEEKAEVKKTAKNSSPKRTAKSVVQTEISVEEQPKLPDAADAIA